MFWNSLNINKRLKKWRLQDHDNKCMLDIFALRIKDIDDRIKILSYYMFYPNLSQETKSDILSYLQDCYTYRLEYTTKIEFFKTYKQWKQQQQAADDSETSQVETDNPPRQELDKLRGENKKNQEDIRRNELLDVWDTITGNPYLVRGGVPYL